MRLLRHLAALALLLAAAAAWPAGEELKVVVHPDNPAVEATRAELTALFLKKTTRWPDGTPAEPVEPASDELRQRFVGQVMERRLSAVKAWWNQQIFSGREVPPLERASEAEVVAWVRTHRGAVGYVGPGADVTGVKVLPVRR